MCNFNNLYVLICCYINILINWIGDKKYKRILSETNYIYNFKFCVLKFWYYSGKKQKRSRQS